MEREQLLALPDTSEEFIRYYASSEADLSLIHQHCGAANPLGFAVQLCYLRFPGVVLGLDQVPAPSVLTFVASHLKLSASDWAVHGQREQTRREHLLHLRQNPVPVVFGGIGLMTTLRQLRSYLRPTPWASGQWLLNHMSGFVGSYIAAVSAFSATSLKFIPFPLNFLWPTLLLVPFLIWTQQHYKTRFARGQRPADVVEVRIQPDAA